ncbi:MAG: rRNA maturation RNase YbeY [Cyclobacteriaceae bacterium]|nr:rRNA maturation RNase YbeY [Cyclobacteriaceae bacterium]
MAGISYFSQKPRFKLKNPVKTSTWIRKVIKKEGKSLRSLNYVFCTDEYLREMNIQFLKHRTYTDIITFNYNPSKTEIEGEIYISVDRVRENAETFQTDFPTELNRVIIHGVLHLLGFNDKTKAEKTAMREKEDACLSLLK